MDPQFGFGAVRFNDFGLRRMGWRHRPRRREIYSHDQRQRAIALRQRGFSYRQIAQRVGQFCSSGTVFQWVRRARQQAQQRAQEQAQAQQQQAQAQLFQ